MRRTYVLGMIVVAGVVAAAAANLGAQQQPPAAGGQAGRGGGGPALGKIEKVDGELYNVEFATFDAVKDPLKMKK